MIKNTCSFNISIQLLITAQSNLTLIKKTPKVIYHQAKPSEYLGDFICAYAENAYFLIKPTGR